jgi:thiosulfate/3-mercaptopyruvate sulfurtransferase
MTEAAVRSLPHLVSVDWLRAEVARSPAHPHGDLAIVDVRWKLGEPGYGAKAYAEGHLPGAVFADLDRHLTATPGRAGRHPLPTAEVFRAFVEGAGISDGTRVVAYDDQGGAIAARLWFLLRYFGHETGAVLDGGLPAWTASGGALSTEVPVPARGSFTPLVRPELIAQREEVATLSGALLLDARAPERYRGDVEPIDPKAGHIPGAVNVPFAGNLAASRFLAPEPLKARYAALGLETRPAIAYCGSGVTACHTLLAAAVAGLPIPRLYPGSWSEWSADPEATVARGDAP